MANPTEVVVGLLLVSLTFLMFLYALPSISDATDTRAGHTQENTTGFTRTTQDLIHNVAQLFPFLIFFVGFALVIKGGTG